MYGEGKAKGIQYRLFVINFYIIVGDLKMIRTVEAIIDRRGHVHLLESVQIKTPRRALVTILEEEPSASTEETALLSEAALAEDWNRPEEDDAWAHLQQDQ
jgi:hypothetical protein